MRLGYDLTTEQSQRLVMNPVLLQSLRILAMNAQDLGELAEQTLLNNPVLEEVTPYKEGLQSYLQEYYSAGMRGVPAQAAGAGSSELTGKEAERVADRSETLTDSLHRQLGMTKAEEPVRSICAYLIDSLDEGGYLGVSPEEVVAIGRGMLSEKQVLAAIELLQGFDPAGIGARDASECLMLQLLRRGELDEIYEGLLTEDLAELSRNHIKELARKYGQSPAEIQRRADVIRTLHPMPGSAFGEGEKTVYLLPDVLLEKSEDGFTAVVNERLVPSLRVSAYYESLMKEGAADKETQAYLTEKVEQAVRFLNAIAQRKETIRKIAQSITDHQTAFLKGDAKDLRPLTMRQVAEEAGVHISTVSRTVRGKYMECPKGLLELRSFFSAGLSGAEGGISSTGAKAVLADILSQEDKSKPYSDETIAGLMQERGITISRRTVAKYRGQLGIPGASKRRRY